jgi:hypothetical protein
MPHVHMALTVRGTYITNQSIPMRGVFARDKVDTESYHQTDNPRIEHLPRPKKENTPPEPLASR